MNKKEEYDQMKLSEANVSCTINDQHKKSLRTSFCTFHQTFICEVCRDDHKEKDKCNCISKLKMKQDLIQFYEKDISVHKEILENCSNSSKKAHILLDSVKEASKANQQFWKTMMEIYTTEKKNSKEKNVNLIITQKDEIEQTIQLVKQFRKDLNEYKSFLS